MSILVLKIQWSLGNTNPGWSGPFWANYSSVFPLEIITVHYYYYYYYYTVTYSISALKSFNLESSDDFCILSYKTEFPVGGLDSRVIRTTPTPYSPDDRRTTILWTILFRYKNGMPRLWGLCGPECWGEYHTHTLRSYKDKHLPLNHPDQRFLKRARQKNGPTYRVA
jgi:hypothetical protein